LSYTDPSIHPSESTDRIDGCEAENNEQESAVDSSYDHSADTPHPSAQTQTVHFPIFRRMKSLLHKATTTDSGDSGALRRCLPCRGTAPVLMGRGLLMDNVQ